MSASLSALLRSGTAAHARPLYAGAVCGVDLRGRVTTARAGQSLAYADVDTPLEPDRRVPVRDDTVFDLASLTKLFVAVLVLQHVERGQLGLDQPVAEHLPGYTGPQRRNVTVRQLLSHAAGHRAERFFWRDFPDPAARRAAILVEPLVATPGTSRTYSCIGYLTLGLLLEQLSGPLDRLLARDLTDPLGLDDTGYRPLDRGVERDRIAATEVVGADTRGLVHDENAASLDGVAGNAGVFSTAADLLVFGRAFLDLLAGRPSAFPLSRSLAREMVTAQALRQAQGTEGARRQAQGTEGTYGLGFRIDDASFMGGLVGQGRAYGHTGFTGTSLVVDEARDLVLVLLTNRVHPSRHWSELNPFRRRVADVVAAASEG